MLEKDRFKRQVNVSAFFENATTAKKYFEKNFRSRLVD
jgi:hypothetical protein